MAANVKLVQGTPNECLATVTGQDRFLTVASSLTAAFCKAVEQGVKPVDQSQTVTENPDPGLQRLICKGWPSAFPGDFQCGGSRNGQALAKKIALLAPDYTMVTFLSQFSNLTGISQAKKKDPVI